MSNFSLGTDGANLIKKHEGFSLKFYGDPYGYPTVGWGHLITDTKVYKKIQQGIQMILFCPKQKLMLYQSL